MNLYVLVSARTNDTSNSSPPHPSPRARPTTPQSVPMLDPDTQLHCPARLPWDYDSLMSPLGDFRPLVGSLLGNSGPARQGSRISAKKLPIRNDVLSEGCWWFFPSLAPLTAGLTRGSSVRRQAWSGEAVRVSLSRNSCGRESCLPPRGVSRSRIAASWRGPAGTADECPRSTPSPPPRPRPAIIRRCSGAIEAPAEGMHAGGLEERLYHSQPMGFALLPLGLRRGNGSAVTCSAAIGSMGVSQPAYSPRRPRGEWVQQEDARS